MGIYNVAGNIVNCNFIPAGPLCSFYRLRMRYRLE